MSENIDESLRSTGEVMRELTAKAREAANSGQSRRSFFQRTATLAGASALGAAGVNLLQPIAARAATTTATNTDTIQSVIDTAATAESLAVTFYYKALEASYKLPDVNSSANQNYFQAALIQEFEHLRYLKEAGAKPLATKFYFPPHMFSDENVFFSTTLGLEAYFISAYLAAAVDFSGAASTNITQADPSLIGFAVQVFGVECEHRALLGVAANRTPPNNLIVEQALLTSVAGAIPPLTPYLTGAGSFVGPITMPSEGEVNAIAEPYGFSFFKKPTLL